ncbi:MAG: hypothetical protein WBF66_01260 [Dehalococcoidia bacterium]
MRRVNYLFGSISLVLGLAILLVTVLGLALRGGVSPALGLVVGLLLVVNGAVRLHIAGRP